MLIVWKTAHQMPRLGRANLPIQGLRFRTYPIGSKKVKVFRLVFDTEHSIFFCFQ